MRSRPRAIGRRLSGPRRAIVGGLLGCRRVAAPIVEGRPGRRDGRPGGLHPPRGRPAGPLRGDLRRALVHDGARRLMDQVLAHFADPAGGFFDTSDEHERLVTRPKDVQDNAVPSGNAMAATVLLRLHAWTGEGALPGRGGTRDPHRCPARGPLPDRASRQWLSAMDLALAPVVEVAIVGEPADRRRRRCWPRCVEASVRARSWPSPPTRRRAPIPLLDGPGRHRWPTDRLCLPGLRLPAAGDVAGGAARGA